MQTTIEVDITSTCTQWAFTSISNLLLAWTSWTTTLPEMTCYSLRMHAMEIHFYAHTNGQNWKVIGHSPRPRMLPLKQQGIIHSRWGQQFWFHLLKFNYFIFVSLSYFFTPTYFKDPQSPDVVFMLLVLANRVRFWTKLVMIFYLLIWLGLSTWSPIKYKF